MMRFLIFSSLLFFSGNLLAVNLDDKVAAMIVVGFNGQTPNDKGVTAVFNQLKAKKVGGVILFSRNIRSKNQLKTLLKHFKSANPKAILAVDQEGGRVARLKRVTGHQTFPAQRWVVERNLDAKKLYRSMACMVHDAGFNVNFAPVVDLYSPQSPAVGKQNRAFHADPHVVEKYAKVSVNAHRKCKVLSVLKHFPGHGSAKGDTHHGFVDVTKDWDNRELLPFQNLIKGGNADAIMVAHVTHQKYDQHPATLSPKIIQGLLRKKLGFRGLVITDDMDMHAIRKNYSFEDMIIRAINAGNDILLFSNSYKYSPKLGERIHKTIMDGVKSGKINVKTIDRAYKRRVRSIK